MVKPTKKITITNRIKRAVVISIAKAVAKALAIAITKMLIQKIVVKLIQGKKPAEIKRELIGEGKKTANIEKA